MVAKKTTLFDKVTEKEAMEEKPKKNIVKKLTSSGDAKDKSLSVKVYPETFVKFTKINKARGMSNNSVVNMMITEYIRANENLLDD